MNRIKRGSFTVEAAVIIPLTVLSFALLLGFAYYTHQRVWCTGVVYESLLAASQRREGDSHTPREEADEHLSARINEAPLLAKGISGSTDGSMFRLSAKCSIRILEDFFGDLFETEVSGSVTRADPAAVKRLEWFGGKWIED